MRKLFFMLSAAVVTILAGCAGSASVGVGVGETVVNGVPSNT